MNRFNISSVHVLIALIVTTLFATVTVFRPLMPVDETRYLTVAWEMLLQGNWILPTLNFEAYSHKPPMLFWLIRSAWEFFGVGVGPARIIVLCGMAALLLLTRRFGRVLSGDAHTGTQAALLLAGLPLFLIYGSVIMFDTLLAVWVTGAMIVLWRLAQGAHFKWWLAFGVLLGLGILTKGPVALVYMLPPALLARLWQPEVTGEWYKGIALAVLTGAIIGMVWAMPAALQGGHNYAEKIFVTQSAGRMVNAFDHSAPVWFYLPVLLGFLAPLLLIPGLWTSVHTGLKTPAKKQALHFMLCWVIPVVLVFSAIDSKQIHYMIPILPGFAALAALSLSGRDIRGVSLPLAFMLLPSIVLVVFEALHKDFLGIRLPESTEHMGLIHIVASALIMLWARRGPGRDRAMVALSMAALVMVVMLHAQLGPRFLATYDLAPLARAIEPYKDRPIAASPKYDGEYGYALRLTHRVESLGRESDRIALWFERNPNGIIIMRSKYPDQIAGYNILYTQPFKPQGYLSILERRPAPGAVYP